MYVMIRGTVRQLTGLLVRDVESFYDDVEQITYTSVVNGWTT